MNRARLFAALSAALLVLSGVPAMARQAAAGAQESAKATPVASEIASPAEADMIPDIGPSFGPTTSRASSRANLPAMLARQMRPVHAILMGSLDSKSAKVGKEVELRTKEPMVTADGTGIPKGTRILGRITAVEVHSKENADALVTIAFDHAELKGGQAVPIRSEIRWIEPPPDPSTSAMLQRVNGLGGGMSGATSVQGGTQTGGLGAGTSGGMTVTGGMLQMTPRQQQGLSSAADYGLQAPDQAPSNNPSDAVIMVASARATPHETGVRGVMLAGDLSGHVSGTFLASGQNVHLDGGTQVVLGLVSFKQ